MLAVLFCQKSDCHLDAFSFTSLILERKGCPRTSRCFVPNFSDDRETLQGIHTFRSVGSHASLCIFVTIVYFLLLGSAVEILKEWNVTGKKKVRFREPASCATLCLLNVPMSTPVQR